ncbi:hypothetical protein ABK040_008683 [Willaertia magna]
MKAKIKIPYEEVDVTTRKILLVFLDEQQPILRVEMAKNVISYLKENDGLQGLKVEEKALELLQSLLGKELVDTFKLARVLKTHRGKATLQPEDLSLAFKILKNELEYGEELSSKERSVVQRFIKKNKIKATVVESRIRNALKEKKKGQPYSKLPQPITKGKDGILLPYDFVIYSVHHFEDGILFGGGGSHGIPNKLIYQPLPSTGLKPNNKANNKANNKPKNKAENSNKAENKAFTKEEEEEETNKEECIPIELNTGDEVVWNLKIKNINNVPTILYCSLDKLNLLKLQNNEFKELDKINLFSNLEDLGKKIVDFNEDFIVTNNDNNDLLIYTLQNDKLVHLFTIEKLFTKYISDISIFRNYIAVISEEKTLKILQINKENNNFKEMVCCKVPNLDKYPKMEFKFCKFDENGKLYVLHTNRNLPTFITTFVMCENDKNEILFEKKETKLINKLPATALSILNVNKQPLNTQLNKELNKEEKDEYIGIGVGGGIYLYKNSNLLFSRKEVHYEAMTCLDLKLKSDNNNNDKLEIVTSGLDRCIGLYQCDVKKNGNLLFTMLYYLIIILVVVLGIYIALLKK